MRVLVLNSGSSTIKFGLFELPGETRLAHGVIERIGQEDACLRYHDAGGERTEALPAPDHAAGFATLLERLAACGPPDAIGHRVAHGGTRFGAPARITRGVLEAIREMGDLAPLHNPANLAGIEAAMAAAPGVPQAAIFDTAFHQTLPEHAWRYAVPENWHARYGVRRYGFHGTSIRYVSGVASRVLERPPDETSLVVLHLGNGASATAVQGGRSVDTSMGLSTLEGLVMGTRCGDLDPAVPGYVAAQSGLDSAEIDRLLHEESGLLALCGASDMREIEGRAGAGDERAELALEVFAHRARRHVGALAATLGRCDALVFTGGIGEHQAGMRARICTGLEVFGLALDGAKNAAPGPLPAAVHAAESRVAALVIATDEELEIARQANACLADEA
ncbi:acetate kinase [Wenzhouxiangella sp. XN24]|uniref:acetate/propionate family kinase n=1 Tax=Wenzhouxiangella sp. XN24 TaxID=2713569 RepID=UPI0013EE3981|nr:acetate kinase [Wenzhouxiangella sp. XN24]